MAVDRDAYRRNFEAIDWKPLPPAPERSRGPVARSDLAVPMVISDTMPETEHIDGRFYTSKSAFRRVTKENGCVEIGNDPARLRIPERPKGDKAKRHEAVRKAIAKVLGA